MLLALAEELGGFVEFVGGKNFAYTILQPLEGLCNVEETVVREKAVESVIKEAEELPDEHVEQYLVPLLKRLSTGDWFSPRTSACGIYAHTYPRTSPAVQAELRAYACLIFYFIRNYLILFSYVKKKKVCTQDFAQMTHQWSAALLHPI